MSAHAHCTIIHHYYTHPHVRQITVLQVQIVWVAWYGKLNGCRAHELIGPLWLHIFILHCCLPALQILCPLDLVMLLLLVVVVILYIYIYCY